jgi:hypothetical protein
MAQFVSDSLRVMRLALGRRNVNDPDSNDAILFQYLQDFINLTMSDDIKIFEVFGTLIFTIDETNTTGVYTFNDVGASDQFTNISQEGFISLLDPPAGSISWNQLWIYQDPGYFYGCWGINNTDVLIPGYPTMMLYYGNQMVFRTIPNTSYQVQIYGYKVIPEFASTGTPEEIGNQPLPYDYWMRYLAYGAAKEYATDFRYEDSAQAKIDRSFFRQRKLLLTRTHNQVKQARCMPRF